MALNKKAITIKKKLFLVCGLVVVPLFLSSVFGNYAQAQCAPPGTCCTSCNSKEQAVNCVLDYFDGHNTKAEAVCCVTNYFDNTIACDTTKTPPCGSKGDADKDDKVSSLDSLKISNCLLSTSPSCLFSSYISRADVNNDGRADSSDITLITNYLKPNGASGAITTFPACAASTDDINITNPIATSDFNEIVSNTLLWVLSVVGSLFLLMVIAGGVMYMVAGGVEERITRAKKIITWSILGLALILASYAIMVVIDVIFTR